MIQMVKSQFNRHTYLWYFEDLLTLTLPGMPHYQRGWKSSFTIKTKETLHLLSLNLYSLFLRSCGTLNECHVTHFETRGTRRITSMRSRGWVV